MALRTGFGAASGAESVPSDPQSGHPSHAGGAGAAGAPRAPAVRVDGDRPAARSAGADAGLFAAGRGLLRRRDDMLEFALDREALLFDPRLETVYCLNETALFIWRCCDGRSREEVALSVASSFEIAHGTALKHTSELLELMVLGGMVEEAP